METTDIDDDTTPHLHGVTPLHKLFPASKIPQDLPMRVAVRELFKSGHINLRTLDYDSDFEHEQRSYNRKLKQELRQFVENGEAGVSPDMVSVTEDIISTSSEFITFVSGRCAIHGLKRQYCVALVSVLLLELRYPIFVVQKLLNVTGRTVARAINEYGWVAPDEKLLKGLHRFFVNPTTNERVNAPLVDLRSESRRFNEDHFKFEVVTPVPPVSIAAVMRGLRAGMDLTVEGSDEYKDMERALLTLVGLAVRRGAPMLTLGWAVNVHHNTIRKYAQRSPVTVYAMGIERSEQKTIFDSIQDHVHKFSNNDIENDEYVHVSLKTPRTPTIVIDAAAPVVEEFGMTSRPRTRLLYHDRFPLLGDITQYRSATCDTWERYTTDRPVVSGIFPHNDADIKTELGKTLLPYRMLNPKVTSETKIIVPLEVTLITAAGVYDRENDPVLSHGDMKRFLLPVVEMEKIAHLIHNGPGADKYCDDVIKCLEENDVTDIYDRLAAAASEEKSLRKLFTSVVDQRARELLDYTPVKYQDFVNPANFEESSLMWTALCDPGRLVSVTDKPSEFKKSLGQLGVVDDGGQIRPPRKRKGGPYAR